LWAEGTHVPWKGMFILGIIISKLKNKLAQLSLDGSKEQKATEQKLTAAWIWLI